MGEVIVAFGGLAQTFQGVTVISADGGSGNDTIIVSDAVTAKAILLGGVGMDMLVGGGGGDEIDGGLGDDTIIGGLGDDILRGSAGHDRLYGRSGVDELHGGLGRDDLFGDEGDDDLFGDEGDDNLFGGAGNDDLFGGAGGDTLQGEGGQDTLRGEAGGDKLLGGNDADTLMGGDGDDQLFGQDGADLLEGGLGDDQLFGGLGNDELRGWDGKDFLDGGLNNDQLFGGGDADTLLGGGGSDQLFGNAGNDLIFGHEDEDGDTVEAQETIDGGSGNDTIYGNQFADTLFGGDGNDTIFGRGGNDWILGQFGDDALFGETGSDVLWGGFVFGALSQSDFDLAFAANFETSPSFDDVEAKHQSGFTPPLITPSALNGQNAEGRLGDGKDTLRGGDGTDFLFGGDEADSLLGNAGSDYLDAGAGNDTNVHGGTGDDVVRGGSGRDALHGDGGIDQLFGGDDDNLFGDAGIDVNGEHVLAGQRLFGGAGRDSLFAFAPTTDTATELGKVGDQLFGGSGGDFLFGNLREEVLDGQSGNDFIGGDLLRGPRYIDNQVADLEGSDDLLLGGSGEDQLLGGGGEDTIWGGADTDWIEGQNGRDLLLGGGIDILVLDVGPTPDQFDPVLGVRAFDQLGDEIHGHFGNETEGDVPDDNATDILLIEGTAGDNTIRLRQSFAGEAILDTEGNPTGDTAVGGQLMVEYDDARLEAVWRDGQGAPRVEQFRVSGLAGNDHIEVDQSLDLSALANRSNDFVAVFDGGPGDDTLVGSPLRDRLDGNSGSDTLFGRGGDDRLWGDGGEGFASDHDTLFAGQGNDDLIGGRGTNALYAWSFDPEEGGEFGIFVDAQGGALFADSAGGTRDLEDTGLNRLLGSQNDDSLYGGTGLDFMFGNGGNDTLYRSDGRTFDSLDDSVAGDAWKQYARSTNKVWYVGASNVDDIIKVDFVTEPGLLAEHHLITRQTSNGENVTFDATVRLDFAATDTGGNSIWDAKDILLDLDRLMTADPRDRQDALGELANAERQLVNNLLPPEGDFLAIIIDALDGNDEITIGPTVQKTVWVDGGAGNDTIKILSGNAILIDQTEFESRNDDAATAYLLGQQAAILAARAAPADGRITRNATFSLQLVNDPGAAVDLAPTVEIKLAATATLDNRDSNDLAKDLNDALAAAGLGDEVGARADGARLALFTRDAGASN